MKYLTIFFLLIIFSCDENDQKGLSAETILKKSIEASGGDNFYNSTMTFNVEDLNYELYRKDNIANYTMTRQFEDRLHKALYSNGSFTYEINGEERHFLMRN